MNPPFRTRRGFTLIELLVVVAVVGILAGLLLPALSRGRAAAMQAACLSNLRQIAAAQTLYANDWDDYAVPCWAKEFTMTSSGRMWIGLRSGTPLTPGDSSTRPINMKEGFLGPYMENVYKAMACPAWDWPRDLESMVGGAGYGYNVYGVGSPAYVSGVRTATGKLSPYGFGYGMKPGAMRQPSRLLAFADACAPTDDGSGIQGYSFIYPPRNDDPARSPVSAGDQIHFRHIRRAGALWADGHTSVESPTRYKAGWSPAAAFEVGGFGPDDSRLFDPRDSSLYD